MNCSFGDIVLVKFSFTDFSTAKKRPGLVLKDTLDNDVIISRITSKEAKSEYDITIAEWAKAGLLLPSIVRVNKILTVSKSIIERKLGNLSDNDLNEIKSKIKMLWKFDS